MDKWQEMEGEVRDGIGKWLKPNAISGHFHVLKVPLHNMWKHVAFSKKVNSP